MHRSAPNSVHHGVDSGSRQYGPVEVVAHSGDFTIGLLHGVRPAANVVVDFIRAETVRVEPCTGFDSSDLHSGLCEWENRYASGTAKSNRGYIDGSQFDSHQRPPRAEVRSGRTGCRSFWSSADTAIRGPG